jgi:hypothetical protein
MFVTTIEEQAAGLYGLSFTVGSLTKVGARNRMQEPGMENGSDEKSMEVRRMAGWD